MLCVEFVGFVGEYFWVVGDYVVYVVEEVVGFYLVFCVVGFDDEVFFCFGVLKWYWGVEVECFEYC